MTEPDVSQLLTVQAAQRIIDAVELARRVATKPIGECVGLRLAEEIQCDRDAPPFDKSLMDGYAVRSGDVKLGGAELVVRGKIAAGQTPGGPLGAGEAAAIMTGAPLPDGADAVVPIELTEKIGDRVLFMAGTKAGRFVAQRGGDAKEGEILLARGTRIGPAQLGVLASVGRGRAAVVEAPTAAVLANGDELVEIDQKPVGRKFEPRTV